MAKENERTVTGMDEYITKEQVIEWFRCYAHDDIPIIFEDLEFDIQHMIPEDVAPVRHGRWKRYGKNLGECSECGEIVSVRNNYCPNCGAKMDLEV